MWIPAAFSRDPIFNCGDNSTYCFRPLRGNMKGEMNPEMKVIKGILKGLDYIEETVIVFLLAFMSIMNFANVFSRKLLSSSFSFTEELTVMAFVWVTMLGIAVGYKKFAHLGMSYFIEMLPRRGQAIMALFSMLCSLVMIVILVQYGVQMVQGQIALNARTPAMQLPTAMQGLSIPVGGIFIAIRTLQAGVTQFVQLWKEAGES